MSYVNARSIFPDDILEMIQKYVEGEYIYIPRREENKKSWGELTQSKKELFIRNNKIYKEYLEGNSIKELADIYYLSPKTIQRIISQQKKSE